MKKQRNCSINCHVLHDMLCVTTVTLCIPVLVNDFINTSVLHAMLCEIMITLCACQLLHKHNNLYLSVQVTICLQETHFSDSSVTQLLMYSNACTLYHAFYLCVS